MKTVLFEAKDIGGELLNTDLIEDWPGEESITGRELGDKMRAHATKFGLTIQTYSPVKKIRSDGDWKLVVMDDGTVHRAYAVIVTVGGEPTKLDVPGEAEFHGRGVSYCAVCDGAFFKGDDLAVVGGGDSAFQEGLFLTRFAKNLSLIHRRDEFRAQPILQDRLLGMEKVTAVTPATVKEIGGDTQVRWIEVDRAGAVERIPVGGVFVFIGFKPVGRHLFEEHIDHDENGYLLTDQFMRTNIPGVYACGDTRAQLAKQITTAVGDATTAVLHAERYIEELKHMRRSFPEAPSATLEREVERMKVRRFLAGQTIIREGDPADSSSSSSRRARPAFARTDPTVSARSRRSSPATSSARSASSPGRRAMRRSGRRRRPRSSSSTQRGSASSSKAPRRRWSICRRACRSASRRPGRRRRRPASRNTSRARAPLA